MRPLFRFVPFFALRHFCLPDNEQEIAFSEVDGRFRKQSVWLLSGFTFAMSVAEVVTHVGQSINYGLTVPKHSMSMVSVC